MVAAGRYKRTGIELLNSEYWAARVNEAVRTASYKRSKYDYDLTMAVAEDVLGLDEIHRIVRKAGNFGPEHYDVLKKLDTSEQRAGQDLAQVEAWIDCLEQRTEGEDCLICQSSQLLLALPCKVGHGVCRDCLSKIWSVVSRHGGTCPLCFEDLSFTLSRLCCAKDTTVSCGAVSNLMQQHNFVVEAFYNYSMYHHGAPTPSITIDDVKGSPEGLHYWACIRLDRLQLNFECVRRTSMSIAPSASSKILRMIEVGETVQAFEDVESADHYGLRRVYCVDIFDNCGYITERSEAKFFLQVVMPNGTFKEEAPVQVEQEEVDEAADVDEAEDLVEQDTPEMWKLAHAYVRLHGLPWSGVTCGWTGLPSFPMDVSDINGLQKFLSRFTVDKLRAMATKMTIPRQQIRKAKARLVHNLLVWYRVREVDELSANMSEEESLAADDSQQSLTLADAEPTYPAIEKKIIAKALKEVVVRFGAQANGDVTWRVTDAAKESVHEKLEYVIKLFFDDCVTMARAIRSGKGADRAASLKIPLLAHRFAEALQEKTYVQHRGSTLEEILGCLEARDRPALVGEPLRNLDGLEKVSKRVLSKFKSGCEERRGWKLRLSAEFWVQIRTFMHQTLENWIRDAVDKAVKAGRSTLDIELFVFGAGSDPTERLRAPTSPAAPVREQTTSQRRMQGSPRDVD